MFWKFVDRAAGHQGALICAGYPHTSRWDGVLAILAGIVHGARQTTLVKADQFQGLQGWMLTRFNCLPIDNAQPRGSVDTLIRHMAEVPGRTLAISPEGRIVASPHWRSGYYVLSLATSIPVSYLWIDYKRRVVTREAPLQLTGDPTEDLAIAARLLKPAVALFPELVGPIRFKDGWQLDPSRLARQRELWRHCLDERRRDLGPASACPSSRAGGA